MGGDIIPEDLLSQLHPLEVKILPHLEEGITVSALAGKAGMQEVEAMRACQWLQNKQALDFEVTSEHEITLLANAKKALERGMPEFLFMQALKEGARTKDEIAKRAGLDNQEMGVSIGLLKKTGWIELEDGKFKLTKKGGTVDPKKNPLVNVLKRIGDGAVLERLSREEQDIVAQLRGRKEYVDIKERRDRMISLTEIGKALSQIDVSKISFEERLTSEDLETGAWKNKRYRSYDVTASVPAAYGGRIHFVQEALNHIRRIWTEMGFTEMTGDYVQTSFWCLDALFVPQDHPARETQDTFYLEYPDKKPIERQAYERIRDVHESGGSTGSKGWQYRYSKDEAERLLLRTHTTVLSAQTLWNIRCGSAAMPGKYFTVGKVFRNEKLDWKHLFEFTQVEGIVIDKQVTFAQLIGYLRVFFKKMGYPKIRVRPHHFPYTEPSVEVDVWHPKKQQWVELGGAGVFRPEVTKTLIGEEVPVLAWGLGLERIIVDFFGLTDLRDLYRNDIGQMRRMKRFVNIEGE